MRIWRALKALGCVALRDGAYLLPAGPGPRGGAARARRRVRARRRQRVADDGHAGLGRRRRRLPAAVRPLGAVRRAAQELEEPRTAACGRSSMTELDAPQATPARRSSTRCGRSTSSRRRRASRPKRPGSTSASASTRSSRPTSRTRPRGSVPRLDPAAVPRPDLGDAAPPLGRPGRERLADPPLHRSRTPGSAGSPSRRTARRARSASTSTARPSRTSATASPSRR